MIRIKIFLIEAEKGQNYKTLHIITPYSKLGISRSRNNEFCYSNDMFSIEMMMLDKKGRLFLIGNILKNKF